jgi:5'(3')-deoxyribonucleotidase
MSKLTVAFDIDGVLARFGKGFVQAVNSLYPKKNLPLDYEPTSWFYEEVLTKEEMDAGWNKAISTPFFWENLDSYTANVSLLKKFLLTYHRDFDVYYTTSRVNTPGDSAFAQTSRWLLYRGLLTANTSLLVVHDPKEKLPIFRGLNIKAVVDDYLPTAVAANEIPGLTSFLYDRPWNKTNRPENLKVVLTLQEYLDNLLRLRENNDGNS